MADRLTYSTATGKQAVIHRATIHDVVFCSANTSTGMHGIVASDKDTSVKVSMGANISLE